MKFLKNVLFAFFLLPLFSSAQSNYKQGYVVTTKGDTLKGFIDYRAWDSNPVSIYFKSTVADHDNKLLGLNDINIFGIDRIVTYKKFTCSISTDITNTSHLVEGRDTGSRTETVFLKVLQQGKNLALYSYSDYTKTRFFVGEAPGYAPTELVYRVYYDVTKSKTGATVNENTYATQLTELADKYDAMDDKMSTALQNLNYDQEKITGTVSRINNLSEAETIKKNAAHADVRLYLGTGLDISKTTSASSSSYTASGGVPYTSFEPGVSVGLDVIPDPDGGKVDLKVDLSIDPSRMNAMYTIKGSQYIPARASYNQLGIFLTPQVQYNFYNAPNFKFFAGVGFSAIYSNYSNAYFQSQNASSPNPYFPVEPYVFNNLDIAILLKAGFSIGKNWEIHYNYYTPITAARGGYFQLNVQHQGVGINYFLGK